MRLLLVGQEVDERLRSELSVAVLAVQLGADATQRPVARRTGEDNISCVVSHPNEPYWRSSQGFAPHCYGARVDSAVRLPVYVLHWNAAERAAATVELLRRSDGVRPEITIVDSGSSPEERAALASETKDCNFLSLPANVGYAGAANAALAHFAARADDDDWCVLAAHDAQARPDTLREMAVAAQRATSYGVLGPAHWSRDFSRPTTIGGRWGMGGLQRARLVRVDRSPHRAASGVVDVCWVSGALMAVRAACARRVGGFDETLFAYWEDVDFCLRAADAGWRVGVVMSAAAAESGSTTPSFAQSYYMARNHLLLARARLGRARSALVTGVVAGMAAQAHVGAMLPWRPRVRRAASHAYARGRWRGLRDGLAGRGGPAPCE